MVDFVNEQKNIYVEKESPESCALEKNWFGGIKTAAHSIMPFISAARMVAWSAKAMSLCRRCRSNTTII